MKNIGRLFILAIIIAAFLLPANGATITVADGDVPGLIAAIHSANANPGPDIIDLAPGGTYTLTQRADAIDHGGLPRITSEITINGNGSVIQRSSAPETPIFGIMVSLFANLTLDGLTIRGGHSIGDGGGLYNNRSQVTLRNSTVTENRANEGGGIVNLCSTLVIENSTISYNTGFGGRTGGGIFNFTFSCSSSTVSINNSTIYENQAGGPTGFEGRGDAIADAFSAPGSIVIKNSIVASPTRGLANDCQFFTPISFGHNIFSDSSCGQNVAGGDLIVPDLTLGPLGDNGGPTPTHALLAGSPAIDAIPIADCTTIAGSTVSTDQRGVARPKGTGCDIGSFEYIPVGSLPNNAVQDFSINANPNGVWSYGYKPLMGQTFTIYTRAYHNSYFGIIPMSIDIWDRATVLQPSIMRNNSNSVITYSTLVLPPDLLLLHPGEAGEQSVLRWTAPASGTFEFQGRFQGLDNGSGTTTNVDIIQNNTTNLFTEYVNGYGAQRPFTVQAQVDLGDTIDFSVGYGSNNTYYSDSTGLAVSATAISINTPTPTPTPNPRIVSLVSTSASPGIDVDVPILLSSQGNEAALSFSLGFDPSKLSFGSVSAGTGALGAVVTVNPSQVSSGRLGILVDQSTPFAAGSRQIVRVRFHVAASSPPGATPVTFTDLPTFRSVSDSMGNLITADWTNGNVTIQMPTPTPTPTPLPGNIINVANCDAAALIAAINASNASPGPDTINLHPNCIYTLTDVAGPDTWHGDTGLPIVQGTVTQHESLTINGNGSTIRRSDSPGTPTFRIFHALYANVVLDSLTIKGGYSTGGGRCGGGGLYLNVSTVLIKNSTITENYGVEGGGICNNNTSVLTIENSTISYNTGAGGRTGGGILNFGGTTSISNSTIYENQADGSLGFEGRGDAIADDYSPVGSIVIKNSIVASPTRGRGNDCQWFTPVSLGHNIFSDSSCGQNVAGGDLIVPNLTLGTLANNGGPTSTHALLAGSPAIDAIPLADCTTVAGLPVFADQRGEPRPLGARCDIGSFETTSLPTLTNRAYVTNQGNNTLEVIDLATNTIIQSIPVGSIPAEVVVSPDGTRLYVTNAGSSSNSVSVIDAFSMTVIATIPVGDGPVGLDITPDGTRVYVGNDRAQSVSVINTATNTVVATRPVVGQAEGVAITPDGTRAYVTTLFGNSVTVIDTATNNITATIPLPTYPPYAQILPAGIDITPDGSLAVVSDLRGASVTFINTATNSIITTITVGGFNARHVDISPDGRFAYVAVEGLGSVVIIDLTTFSVVSTIPVGTSTWSVAVSKNGSRAYVTNYNSSLAIIDTGTRTVVGNIPYVPGRAGIALWEAPDTHFATTTSLTSNSPTTFGNDMVFTATVASAAGTPTGTVDFYQDSIPIGSAPLNGGVAVLTRPTFNAYTINITAAYAAQGQFLESSGSTAHTINKAIPTVAVTGGVFAYDGNVHPATAVATGVLGEPVTIYAMNISYAPDGSTPPSTVGVYAVIANFISGDSNYENATGSGTIQITDATPPLIEPSVVGTLGNNGWYTGDVSVSWAVTDPDSTVSSSTGCEAVNVTSDTTGTTYTCSATSGGGAASQSVTIKRDAAAPAISSMPSDLTVEAAGAGGKAVAYGPPSAVDAVSGVVSLICAPASGSTFAIGTTEVICTATDNAGNSATAKFNVTVADTTAPVLSNISGNLIVQATGTNGAVVTWSSPSATDAVDGPVVVSCAPASGSTFAHGVTTVTCTATDSHNNTGSRSFTVEVTNAPPTANAGGSYQVNEGGSVALSGTGADPEGAALTYAWDLDNNGTFETAGQNVTFLAAGLDGFTGSSRTVKLCVRDAAGLTAVSTAAVNVLNVAPTITSLTAPAAPQAVNTTVNLSLSFTDPAGSLDTYTVTTNWGDGTTNNGTSHLYTTAGVYRVKVVVSDEDGGVSAETQYEYVVVFDQSAGFVTGGGWIMSPAGAYTANPSLTGKATFGFVSKYQRGANQPSGNTEFQFHAGDFRFSSTAYEWLVVAGAKAQYKGAGTVNGVSGYSFMLTATDGQVNGGGGTDKFRIKIWNAGGVVYDNVVGGSDKIDEANPQAINGGSIMIRSGN